MLVGQAVRRDEAMGPLKAEGETTTLEREPLVDHDDGQGRPAARALNEARDSGHAFRQLDARDLQPLLLEQLGHIGNGVDAQLLRVARVVRKLLGIRNGTKLSRALDNHCNAQGLHVTTTRMICKLTCVQLPGSLTAEHADTGVLGCRSEESVRRALLSMDVTSDAVGQARGGV